MTEMPSEQKALLAKFDEAQALATITNIPDARKWLHISEGLVEATIKEYKAADIKGTKDVRDASYRNAVKASKLRLMLEAKLGELLKIEQESGLRAKSSTDGTLQLKDYGLTKKDSHRAQQIYSMSPFIPCLAKSMMTSARWLAVVGPKAPTMVPSSPSW